MELATKMIFLTTNYTWRIWNLFMLIWSSSVKPIFSGKTIKSTNTPPTSERTYFAFPNKPRHQAPSHMNQNTILAVHVVSLLIKWLEDITQPFLINPSVDGPSPISLFQMTDFSPSFVAIKYATKTSNPSDHVLHLHNNGLFSAIKDIFVLIHENTSSRIWINSLAPWFPMVMKSSLLVTSILLYLMISLVFRESSPNTHYPIVYNMSMVHTLAPHTLEAPLA